ncbi:IclR family transcriptional regulator [Mycolicibacterium sp.]|uniref:IclR family transcriptional regulator n=1 Tax=Mycolicibacterium sp. TaxID=2320850 RepID=UPI0037CCBA8E
MTSKVTAILMAFGDGAVLTLTEIAGIAKLPTSTAHRLASELLAWRLLERTEQGGYRIGLPLRIIGKDAADFDVLNRAILIMRARPVLGELARTIRTDAKLGTLLNDEVVYLGHSGPSATGSAPLTPTLPAHATAIGKALLAFSPTSVVDRILAEGMRTAKTVTTSDKIRQALSVIRLTQVATARDELQADRSAIAVPVFSGGGKVAAAIELTIREPGMDVNAATGALTVACRSLSRQLATELRDQGSDQSCGHGNETAV